MPSPPNLAEPHLQTFTHPPDDAVVTLLRGAKRIAVVGCSPHSDRPSYRIARYLQKHGYDMIPVNPNESEILGKRSYPDLHAAAREEGHLDVVVVFRRSEQAGVHVDEAVEVEAEAVWLQSGIVHEESGRRAHAAGLMVVMDRCIYREHKRLLGSSPSSGDRASPQADS